MKKGGYTSGLGERRPAVRQKHEPAYWGLARGARFTRPNQPGALPHRIVLSHDHYDHVSGLPLPLGRNHDLDVYLPFSAGANTRQIVNQSGATVYYEQEPAAVCTNVCLTGEMPGQLINEQFLILNTAQGLVIVTGCAHQGITNILTKAKQIMDKDIYLVVGGFHLLYMSETQIRGIISEFQRLGVRKCGPSHCTGDLTIRLFREAYGQDYETMGTGRIIEIPATPAKLVTGGRMPEDQDLAAPR